MHCKPLPAQKMLAMRHRAVLGLKTQLKQRSVPILVVSRSSSDTGCGQAAFDAIDERFQKVEAKLARLTGLDKFER